MDLPDAIDIDELLSEEDPDYDWLVPALIEVGDRTIFTGNEGAGKSTLLRQMMIRIAAGMHPFDDDEDIGGPKRVLCIDLENSRNQVKRALRPMRELVVERPRLTMCCWPMGIDLTNASHCAEVQMVIAAVMPQLLVLGPMYKMAPDLQSEEISKAVAEQLDRWRTLYKFALILESHQPHQVITNEGRWRPERPFGSSLWLRWPEFGMCLENGGVLRPWRGARDERDWPERLYYGSEWPWEVGGIPRCRQCQAVIEEGTKAPAGFCTTQCAQNWRKAKSRAKLRVV